MSNLMLPENMPVAQYDENVLADLSKTGDWLPRITVTGSTTELVKANKIGMGVVALVTSNDIFKDLGKSVDLILTAWRPRALRMPIGSNPLSYFDPNDPEFRKVMAESEIKDSRCIYGPEFLCWIPSEDRFALLHLSSKTSRREGQKCLILMKNLETGRLAPAAATIKPRFIKTPRYSWWAFEVLPCSTELQPLPDLEDTQEQMTKFLNPPKISVEKAEPVGESRER